MPDLLDRLGAALLDASLAALAISGLVVLAMIQGRQPARRRGWARAGLLSTLALLPLAAANPVPRIDLRGPLRSLLSTEFEGPAEEARGVSTSPFDRLAAEEGRVAPEGGPIPPSGGGWARSLARGVVLAYLVRLSIGLGRIALGIFGAAWLIRRARPPSPGALAELRSLPFEGGSRRPALGISDRATRPVLVGWLRSTILIPPDLDVPEARDRLRLSLLHELAHAEALDHRFGPASSLAQATWFFLPPVWWIRDQMKLDQEFLADRRAVDHYGTSGGYASSLVELAGSSPLRLEEGRAMPAVARSSKGPGVASALFQRVLMLLKCPFAIEGQTPLWWRWSTAATLALTTVAASCLTLRGLAGLATDAPPALETGVRSFRLARLDVGQREHDDQPFDLRFRLPDRFTLTFEVLAEPEDLSSIEVLGHKLGEPDVPEPDPTRAAYRLWHRVRIRRSRPAETVEVDGRRLAPDLVKLSPWLTIRTSPGRTARLRDLDLSW